MYSLAITNSFHYSLSTNGDLMHPPVITEHCLVQPRVAHGDMSPTGIPPPKTSPSNGLCLQDTHSQNIQIFSAQTLATFSLPYLPRTQGTTSTTPLFFLATSATSNETNARPQPSSILSQEPYCLRQSYSLSANFLRTHFSSLGLLRSCKQSASFSTSSDSRMQSVPFHAFTTKASKRPTIATESNNKSLLSRTRALT